MKKKILIFTLFIGVCVFFVILSLFQEWELSHETWSYWYFSRVFDETHKFVVVQRSPLYILYLLIFKGLHYPQSIIYEYVLTTVFTVIGLVALFIPFIGIPLSFIFSILWIPYMQASEPPVQKLALAVSCIAIVIRLRKSSKKRISFSYGLLILSYLFRPTYLFLLFPYLFHDLIYKKGYKKIKVNTFIDIKSNWLLIFSLGLVLIFELNQSSNKFNNVFFTSTEWFPHDGKHEEIIQNYNRSYITQKYGTFEGKDFYFTNKELFSGAATSVEALLNNPRFVINQLFLYISQAIEMTVKFTVFVKFNSFFPINLGILLLILLGSIYEAKKNGLVCFLVGSMTMYAATVAFMPQYRYLIFPLIPIFGLSSIGYAELLIKFFKKNPGLYYGATLILIVLFSPTLAGIDYYGRTYLGWPELIKSIIFKYNSRNLKIMEVRSSAYASSLKDSYKELSQYSKKCKGIISLEYTFLGAFTGVSLDQIYDIWEIPPYGNFKESNYTGLRGDRINCLFISRELMLYPGEGTNSKIRYENYILPYKEKLKLLGSKEIEIPSYGYLVIPQ